MNILADRPHEYIFFLLIHYLSLTTEKPPKTTISPASLKLDPQWLELLHLRFNCALTDRAIARKMGIRDRTIRNYWVRIQEALNIIEHPDKDIRVQIELKARELRLID